MVAGGIHFHAEMYPMKRYSLSFVLLLATTIAVHAAPPVAFVLADPSLPGTDIALTSALTKAVQTAGFQSMPTTVNRLLMQGDLYVSKCRMLVLPQCRSLPVALAPVIEKFLKSGGHLIALGAPAWSNPLIKGRDGRWVPIAGYGEKDALLPPGRKVFGFDAPLTSWDRSSDHLDVVATYETTAVTSAPVGRSDHALHAVISNLQGWDTLGSPASNAIFGPGESVTIFSAKGGPRTRALAVEWEERDGARWIATVPLTERWQRYTLPPSAFKSWSNPPERATRGFQPQNAARLKIGLAYTHTGQMSGRHEYWISSVGVAPQSAVGPDLATEIAQIPILDTLSPPYKFFPMHGALTVAAADAASTRTQQIHYTLPAGLTPLSSSPRPSGAGFLKGRTWRWLPLQQAYSSSSSGPAEWRGNPATLMIHGPGDSFAGGVWLVVAGFEGGNTGIEYFRQKELLKQISAAAHRMREGIYLLEAGTDCYCYEQGKSIKFGATALNVGTTTAKVMVDVTFIDHATGAKVLNKGGELQLQPGASASFQGTWQPPTSWPKQGYRIQVVLRQQNTIIERIQHDITLYTPAAPASYVRAQKDGHFYNHGKLWRINGVNYMPSSGIAQEEPHLFEHWLSREAYDPDVVERDLTHIEQLGMNAVSIFVYRDSLESHNLLDALQRCRKHHLKVNLSLRPGVLDSLHATPPRTYEVAMDAAIENFTSIIRRYGLNRDDTIFAFETAWEPNFGSQQARQQMDAQWLAWIVDRYQTLKLAEAAWNHAAPHTASAEVTNPSGAQMAGDESGATRMVTDYRVFLDSWLDRTYGAATHAIKELAPDQMVSFRMASAGFPGDDQRGDLPYQFEGLTRAVDFLSPECYGRVGGEEGEEGILFEAAYARAVAPTMPIIWAEAGFTAWDPAGQHDDSGALDFQGRYLDTFYRLAYQSGVDGIFWWWYPGGFRTGENSDFGIINPDGTDRPATAAIRHWASKFLNSPLLPEPEPQFNFIRDIYADGIHGVFQTLKNPFHQALKFGKRPGLHVLRY